MGVKVEEDGESEEDEEEVMTRERLSQDMSVDREWGGRGCSRVGDSLELDDGADLERLPGVWHKYGDSGGQTTFKLQYFVKLSVPKSPG